MSFDILLKAYLGFNTVPPPMVFSERLPASRRYAHYGPDIVTLRLTQASMIRMYM